MRLRKTRSGDRPAIDALLNRARLASPILSKWEAQLAQEGFVVTEIGGRIEGALLASSDESPVGWVRLAALSHQLRAGPWLDISLPPVLAHLRRLHVRELAWMDHCEWVGPLLEMRGFTERTEVITLAKRDRTAPCVGRPSITLRPASRADFGTLALIDRLAFAPMWWRSEATIRRRATTASRFMLAEDAGEVLGYAESEQRPPMAHLNRIAVRPDHDGEGIGACLLEQVLTSLWESGVQTISLNTQRTNRRARRLYSRFGFAPTGESATVWALQL